MSLRGTKQSPQMENEYMQRLGDSRLGQAGPPNMGRDCHVTNTAIV